MKFLSNVLLKAGLIVEGTTDLQGTATAVTPTISDSSTKIATTAFVKNQGYILNNIYSADGSLTGNRTITLNGNYLDIAGVTKTRFFANGNVVIDGANPVDAGFKFDVGGSVRIMGTGTTAAVNFLIQDSAATDILRIVDNGTVTMNKGAFLANNSSVTHRIGLLQINGSTLNGLSTIQISSAGGQAVSFPGSNLFFAAEQLWNLTTFIPLNLVRSGVTFTANWTNSGAGIGSTGNAVVANISTSQSLGNNFLNNFSVKGTIATAGGNTTYRGFFYDPTITSSTGLTNIAFESTSGIVKISTLAGSGDRMVVANSSGVLSTQAIPALTGYVPYTGATANLDLGIYTLSAYNLIINHTSGSGVAAQITKGGNGEALTVVKSSGSGNAASITGGVTLLDELHLNTDLADAYIASATNWNAAYNDKINSAAVTGTTTKTLTLTQQDGGTITASWTDDNTDAVTSVFGRTGAVVATSGDYTTAQVTESGNLYFTNARAIASTLTGYTSGAGTITSSDSILSAIQKLNGNIGALTTGVSSVNGLTGAVTLTTSNIAEGTNLYYTEARVNANTNVAANTAARHNAVTLGTANGLSLSTQVLSLGLASTSTTGALSSTDWNTFNNKTSNTGTVTSVGLSSATSGVTIGSTPITTSGTITLAIATASGSQQGLLSSTDWTTFNNKQNALTNPVTGTGTTNYLPKFTGASTIGNSSVQDNGTLVTITSNTAGNSTLNLISSNSVNSGKIQFGGATFGATIEKNSLGADSGLIFNSYHGGAANYTFLSNGNTVMTLNASGNLSIGNTNDTYKLDVTGNIRSSETVLVGNGAAQTELRINSLGGTNQGPFMRFQKAGSNKGYIGTYSAIISGTSDDLTYYATGSQQWMTNNSTTTKMLLDASGNLGLGVTPSAWISGVGRTALQVGITSVSTSAANDSFFGTNYYDDGSNNRYINSDFSLIYAQQNGNHIWYNAPSGTAGNAISFTQAMTLDASGRLGIGTTAPGNPLTVVNSTTDFSATSRFYSTENPASEARHPSIAIGWGIANLDRYIRLGTGPDTGFGTNFNNVNYLNSTGKDFTIGTGSNSAGLAERIRITTGGNVGIGTTSPDQKLTIQAQGTSALISFKNSAGTTTSFVGVPNANGDVISSSTTADFLFRNETGNMLFQTFGSERMRITSGGQVSINTTQSLAQLNVKRSSSGSTVRGLALYNNIGDSVNTGISLDFYVNNGDDDRCARIISTQSTAGLYADLQFHTSNNALPVERMRITSGGNVGIGTTNPGANLDVAGGYIYAGNSDQIQIRGIDNGGIDYFAAENTTFSIRTTAYNNPIVFSQVSGERMRINSSGNVLIGGTSSDYGKLDVTVAPSSYTAALGLGLQTNSGEGNSVGISFKTKISLSGAIWENARIAAFTDAVSSSVYGALAFYTMSATTLSERMRIGNNGFVGIGVVSPAYKLEVNSSTGDNHIAAVGTAPSLQLMSANTSPANWATIGMATASNHFIVGAVAGDFCIANRGTTAGNMLFGFGSSERMRITSAGNVGIGTTGSSNTRVSINGADQTSSNYALAVSGSSSLYIYVRNDGYLYSASAWSGSDRRLKENITDLDNGLNKILGIKARKFDFINGFKNQYGFIAQELQQIIPNAVSVFDEKNGMLAIKMDFIVPHLVKAIQELKAELDTLKNK